MPSITYIIENKWWNDKKFGIGLSLNKNKLTEVLESKKYPLNKLIELGLTTEMVMISSKIESHFPYGI